MNDKYDDPVIAFGKRIRRLRREREMTQEHFASLCKLHPTYISQIERGKRNISLNILLTLAEALDCIPEKLVKDLRKSKR